MQEYIFEYSDTNFDRFCDLIKDGHFERKANGQVRLDGVIGGYNIVPSKLPTVNFFINTNKNTMGISKDIVYYMEMNNGHLLSNMHMIFALACHVKRDTGVYYTKNVSRHLLEENGDFFDAMLDHIMYLEDHYVTDTGLCHEDLLTLFGNENFRDEYVGAGGSRMLEELKLDYNKRHHPINHIK